MNEEVQAKWWASALMIGGVIGLICLPVAALGTRVGLWSFELGIPLMGIGAVLAVIVLFLGIIAFVYCLSRGLQAERSNLLIGIALSAVVLGVMGSQVMAAGAVPAIHNISTDTSNPPQFDKIVALRGTDSNPLEYSDEVAEQQQAAYPQLKPLISQVAQGEMINRVTQVLQDLGMEVVDINAGAGRVEATDTTFWFGFKDDVVVRVRPEGGGSVVDVRSVSRVGQSDLGKNAARIMEILNALGAM